MSGMSPSTYGGGARLIARRTSDSLSVAGTSFPSSSSRFTSCPSSLSAAALAASTALTLSAVPPTCAAS
eukprot:948234-Prymnesium_polylepis.1